MRNSVVKQGNSVVEQCRTAWWNSGTVWHSMVEQCGTEWWNHGTVEQCTVWWNSGEQYNGTVEQYGGTVEQYGGTVKQCGRTVWNSVVEQCGTVW